MVEQRTPLSRHSPPKQYNYGMDEETIWIGLHMRSPIQKQNLQLYENILKICYYKTWFRSSEEGSS